MARFSAKTDKARNCCLQSLDECSLQVKRATPRPPGKTVPASANITIVGKQSAPSARVLIEGLDACLSEAQIQQHFSKWGAVSDVALLPTQPTQTCIVTFASHIDAKRACDQSERSLAGLVRQLLLPSV